MQEARRGRRYAHPIMAAEHVIEARLVELPAGRLAGLRYEGAPPTGHPAPAPGLAEHWQRFRRWLQESGASSSDPDVLAIAYTPSGPIGGPLVVELCVPVGDDFAPGEGAAVTTRRLGGRFVLASGTPEQMPRLLRAARSFATSHGLPFERGSIEIYRPGEGGTPRVDAGVRIHD